MLNLILILLIVVSAILLTVTVILIMNSSQKLKSYRECIGTIIKFYENSSPMRVGSEAHKAISPVVSYTVNGKTYEFIGNYCSTWMKVGDKINILYNNEDHSKATIKKGLYVAPMIIGALTLLFALALVIFVVLQYIDF